MIPVISKHGKQKLYESAELISLASQATCKVIDILLNWSLYIANFTEAKEIDFQKTKYANKIMLRLL